MFQLAAFSIVLGALLLVALAGMAVGADSRDGVDGASITGRRAPRGGSWW